MSGLLTPWLENACFQTLLEKDSSKTAAPTLRPRLAQVRMARLHNDSNVHWLVLSDGQYLIVCILKDTETSLVEKETMGIPRTGCIVRIDDYCLSLLNHCIKEEDLNELLQSNDSAVNLFLTSSGNQHKLCLHVGQIKVIGDAGPKGDPSPIEDSIQVKRALLHLSTNNMTVAQQLGLEEAPVSTPSLGNVQDLLTGSGGMLQTILALNKKTTCTSKMNGTNENGDGGAATATTSTTNSGVRLGNVQSLLELARAKAPETTGDTNNTVQHHVQLSTNNNSTGTGGGTSEATAATTETEEEGNGQQDGTTTNGVALGNVATLMQENSMDTIFAAAAAARVSTTGSTRNNDKTNGYRTKRSEQQQQQQQGDEEDVVRAARAVEPYGIRERLDSRASVVSLSGITTALRSVLSRRSFLSSSQEDTSAQAQSQEQEDSEASQQVVGISDMLISQTQDDGGDMQEVVAAAEETVNGGQSTTEDTIVSRSNKRTHVLSQEEEDDDESVGAAQLLLTQPPLSQGANDDEDNENDAFGNRKNMTSNQETDKVARKDTTSTKRPKKKRRKGMLSMWKEQRARRKEKGM